MVKKNIYEKENTVIDRRESFHLFFVIERIKFFFLLWKQKCNPYGNTDYVTLLEKDSDTKCYKIMISGEKLKEI